MPPEIADSDAESDFNSPVKPLDVPSNAADNAGLNESSISKYDNYQSLDPTQRLSSLPSSEIYHARRELQESLNPLHDTSEVTMDQHTRGIITSSSDISSVARSKKRAHSVMQDSSKESPNLNGLQAPSAKRTKTYAHPSKTHMRPEIDLFAPDALLGSREPDQPMTDQFTGNSGNQTKSSAAPLITSLAHPSDASTLLGQSATDVTHRLTTSVASMGRYESLNLDFRGSHQGLDINANPFGSLSQASLDEDPNPNETERFASMFRLDEQQRALDLNSRNSDSVDRISYDQLLPAQYHSRSLPHRSSSIENGHIIQNDGATPDPLGDSHEHTQGLPSDASIMVHPLEALLPPTEKPQPKKRGRKPKNARVTSRSPAPGVVEEVDELALPDLPPTNTSRQGTVDSLSQASQTSTANASVPMRKRRKSKQVSDEAAQNTHGGALSPVKNPTSELNLSDEAMIGLPKEAYKPRASRSRSKKIPDEDGLDLLTLFPGTGQETPTTSKMADLEDSKGQEIATPAKPSAKKGRKSKVKRAKTSAAALLKRAEPMISDGEEDVVWMDTKPAPVKLDLPRDLKMLKKEIDMVKYEGAPQPDKTDTNLHIPKESIRGVTVEIPVAADTKGAVAEPKKRGRKPKKTQLDEPQVVEEREDDGLHLRPPLAEKTPNMPVTVPQERLDSREVKAPTMSPILPPEASSQHSPDKNPDPETTLTTPFKPAPATEKGPTNHSPTNPPKPSSGKKSIYRIGLSRRQHIPSLLRKVQRDKAPPKAVARKEKETKRQKEERERRAEEEDEGDGNWESEMRGADGMLIEWGD